jgi:8-oxo-dGTP pyrophosphatase MutT (NUDIX family)
VNLSFGEELHSLLRANLDRHPPLELPHEGRRRAAVAVVVTDSDADLHGADDTDMAAFRLPDIPGADTWDGLDGKVAGTAGGPAVLLTRRGVRLNSHARQWALPGGRVDEGETLLDTARRELAEELGLVLDETALLGRLDDYATRSGYVITPFVFWGGADPVLQPDPTEVASVHRIALRELARRPRFIRIPESDRPVLQVPIGGDLIHAPTGAVLYQFRRVAVDGRFERVHHLEQPVFAWR